MDKKVFQMELKVFRLEAKSVPNVRKFFEQNKKCSEWNKIFSERNKQCSKWNKSYSKNAKKKNFTKGTKITQKRPKNVYGQKILKKSGMPRQSCLAIVL